MKKVMQKLFCLMMVVVMSMTMFVGCDKGEEPTQTTTGDQQSDNSKNTNSESGEQEPIVVKMFSCWNGSSGNAPRDHFDNVVANKIYEETGVIFDIEYATSSESENLNMMFSSGDVPYDVVTAPYWGGNGGETGIIKRAASQGMLMSLEGLLDEFGPNIKRFEEGAAKDYLENDVYAPEYNGHTYVIPYQLPATPEDSKNWGYTVYVRKDIMEALGWKREDFNHSEKIYEFLKEVKAGDFKDINGNPVIPAGNWHNGWDYSLFTRSYHTGNMSSLWIDPDTNKAIVDRRSPLIMEEVLFMRKLVAEGLFDPEAFRQNDTVAKEKHAVGKYAVHGVHYFHQRDFYKQTLYVDHPEMEYVPVGPIPNSQGIAGGVSVKGRAGSPIWFIPADTDSAIAEAAIKAINYLNSEEGRLLAFYGIEGTHFDMVDGQPRMREEFVEMNKDGSLKAETGIQGEYRELISLYPYMSQWGEFTPGEAEVPDATYELIINEIVPNTIVDGYRASNFINDYDKKEEINELLNGDLWRDYRERAYFSETDEEAIKIIEEYQQYLIDGGIEEYEAFINEKAAERDDVLY
ncbi:extracellular solute-binding protein [Vallitalea okinawensis]|uniref:extracellular solute-binding protein n=1 Tax=Vallitalea okinawensis TaxID=2078660 RepID=UPI000CFA85F3|nr:extracellular solute-binding protein [Vallitalea okinawensis]